MKIFDKSQNKIILVIYAGIKNLSNAAAKNYVTSLLDYSNRLDESIYTLIIPDNTLDSSRVKCLNPVVISKDQYSRIDNIIKEAEEKLKSFTV